MKDPMPVAGEPLSEDLLRAYAQLAELYRQALVGDIAFDEAQADVLGGRPAPSPRRRPARAPAAAQTCGARLRDGSPCARPPVEGRRRCRSHGCAPRAGAPKGNRNALKHGCFTAAEMARKRRISAFIRECNETLRAYDEMMKQQW